MKTILEDTARWLKETAQWLKGSAYGYQFKDKIILFTYICNATVVMIISSMIHGEHRATDLSLKRTHWLNWMSGSEYVVIKRNGALLSLPLILDYVILAKPDWERCEREFIINMELYDNANKNLVILDVGAHIGFYTAMLAKQHPQSKIVAIEASPNNFAYLKKNCTELNNFSNVTLLNRAISDRNDEELELYEKHSLSTLFKEFIIDSLSCSDDRGLVKVKVGTTTIDKLVKNMNVQEISLLKIDIEGAEALALSGAICVLKEKKVKNIVIEYHSVENYNFIVNLLEALGYSYYTRKGEGMSKNAKYINGHIMASLNSTLLRTAST